MLLYCIPCSIFPLFFLREKENEEMVAGGKGGGRIPISEISPSKNIPPSRAIFFSPSALISEMNPSSLGVRTHGWEKEMRASGAF